MVYIDMQIPEVCASCPINFWNRCRLLEWKVKTSGRIENPDTERLSSCPLQEIK